MDITVRDGEQALRFIESIEGDHYGYHVRQFVSWMRERGASLSPESIIDYFADLNDSDYKAATKRIKRQAVKKRLRQLARLHGLGSEFSVNLEQFLKDLDRETRTKAPKLNGGAVTSRKLVSPEEYAKMLADARSARQELFLKFLWVTGCRISELTGIRLVHCEDQYTGVLITVTGKGNKEREIRVPHELFTSVRDTFKGRVYLFETSAGTPYNRNYVSNQIARIAERTIGRTVRAHAFRHSFVSRKIRETQKVTAVSRYVGHSSVSITLEMYNHEELGDEELWL